MTRVALPEGAASELRRVLQSSLKSLESLARAEVARAQASPEKGECGGVGLG